MITAIHTVLLTSNDIVQGTTSYTFCEPRCLSNDRVFKDLCTTSLLPKAPGQGKSLNTSQPSQHHYRLAEMY